MRKRFVLQELLMSISKKISNVKIFNCCLLMLITMICSLTATMDSYSVNLWTKFKRIPSMREFSARLSWLMCSRLKNWSILPSAQSNLSVLRLSQLMLNWFLSQLLIWFWVSCGRLLKSCWSRILILIKFLKF